MLRVANGDDGDNYDDDEVMTKRTQLLSKDYCVDVDLKARSAPCGLNVQSRNLAISVFLNFLLHFLVVVPLSILHAGWHKSCRKKTAQSANPLWDFKPEDGQILTLGCATFRMMVVLFILRCITMYFSTTVWEATDALFDMRCIIPNSETETYWKVRSITDWAGEWIFMLNGPVLFFPWGYFTLRYLLFSCRALVYDVETTNNYYQPLPQTSPDYAPESINDILRAVTLARGFITYAMLATPVTMANSWLVVDLMSTVHDVFAAVNTDESDWCPYYPDGGFGADSGEGGFDRVKWALQVIIIVFGSLGLFVLLCVYCRSIYQRIYFGKVFNKFLD